MKNKGIIVPLLLAGIVLFLVLVTAVTKRDFKRSPAETLKLAKTNAHLIGSSQIARFPAGQVMILKIGVGKIPVFSPAVETKELDISNIGETGMKALLSDKNKTKVLFALEISDAVKAWTLLTRMGY